MEGKAALDAEGLVQSSRKTLNSLKCFLSTITDVDRKLLPTFQAAELDLLQELSHRHVDNEIKDLKGIGGDDGSKLGEELEGTMSSLKAWLSDRGEGTFKLVFEWISNLWGPESNIAVASEYATKADNFINALRGAGALAALVGCLVCFKRTPYASYVTHQSEFTVLERYIYNLFIHIILSYFILLLFIQFFIFILSYSYHIHMNLNKLYYYIYFVLFFE